MNRRAQRFPFPGAGRPVHGFGVRRKEAALSSVLKWAKDPRVSVLNHKALFTEAKAELSRETAVPKFMRINAPHPAPPHTPTQSPWP